MPESIRSLLHDIADDAEEPTRDLAAGAYQRARGITRRRIAAGAIGVVTALALAGAGTAGLNRHQDPGPSPAEEETTETDENESLPPGCGVRPEDWDDLGIGFPALGESGTEQPREELPYRMNYQVQHDEYGATTWGFFDTGEVDGLDVEEDYRYVVAPDGNRVMAVDRADECTGVYMEIGLDSSVEPIVGFSLETTSCGIAWSPDSDKLLFSEPVEFDRAKTYVLDVTTGDFTVLGEMGRDLFCSSEWMPDGERIWSGRTTIWNLDGTLAQELPGLEASLATENWLDAGISADAGEACFDEVGEGEGDGVGRFCDVYVDTATGDEIALPVGGERRQVVFLADGSMLILSHEGDVATQYLVDPAGEVIDQRDLPMGFAGSIDELVTYFPW
ncbi:MULTISPECIES: hypothetical protein [Glycomyces]|uniref:WD40 repeat domain-containing protein n=2 Tax=Glycomyces TaxID=58113 RepID=A0A9X3PKZ1_9ACTN|nr:hypothetical protein [Glycomyces lechevalierae]MDA1385736.1 hypothetical protein [Glycomyces lechevalierae]MDR7339856.1 hypothetical protein [Glycomyces lechevalierae]